MSFELFNAVAEADPISTGFTNVDEQMRAVQGAWNEVQSEAFSIAGGALIPGVILAVIMGVTWGVASKLAKAATPAPAAH
jgi:hypothetical protein